MNHRWCTVNHVLTALHDEDPNMKPNLTVDWLTVPSLKFLPRPVNLGRADET